MKNELISPFSVYVFPISICSFIPYAKMNANSFKFILNSALRHEFCTQLLCPSWCDICSFCHRVADVCENGAVPADLSASSWHSLYWRWPLGCVNITAALKAFLSLCVCVCMSMCVHAQNVCVAWTLEDNFLESASTFCPVGPRDWSQVALLVWANSFIHWAIFQPLSQHFIFLVNRNTIVCETCLFPFKNEFCIPYGLIC